MTTPYQFAFHDRVSPTAPQSGTIVLSYNRLIDNEKLDRKEKDALFHSIVSNSRFGLYKLGGWVFPFKQFMKRFLVKRSYESSWDEVWAFDKTCIRNSFYTNECIVEILEAPLK